jgi:HEAT repeat protein
MPQGKNPQQLEFDFSGQQEADPLAAGTERLRKLLLRSYLKNLTDASWRVRKKGARGLGELGPEARETVPTLEALLEDADSRVREAAALALHRMRPQR